MKSFIVAVALAGGLFLGAALLGPDRSVGDPQYLTAAVEPGRIVREVSATGVVKAVVTVAVGSQLSGQITELLADFNDQVRQGDAIARLDRKRFLARVHELEAQLAVARTSVQIERAAMQRAESAVESAIARAAVIESRTASALAEYTVANNDYERKLSLRANGRIAESEIERAEATRDAAFAEHRGAQAAERVHAQEIAMTRADLARAEVEIANAEARVAQMIAALQQAEIDLERTVIRAPIDGVIIGRDVELGQTVAASLEAPTLFTIAQDLARMEVHARIDEADIGRIRPGQTARFSVDAFPGRVFSGEVSQIRKAPQTVQNVVTYTVVIVTANPDLLLLPGMTALVRVVVAESVEGLVVPGAALRYEPSQESLRAQAAAPGEGAEAAGGRPAVVWVLEPGSGAPTPVPVRIGMEDGSRAELVGGGLEAGTPLVVGEQLPPREGLLSSFSLRL